MDFEELNFDDVIADAEKRKQKKKKKIDSKDKGNRFERNLCKALKARFGMDFSRTTGSGNRWGQVFFLPDHAQQTYSGDLVCPENFKFVIECKGGYEDIDLHSCFEAGLKSIDKWIQQSLDESERCGRRPIIFWKKNYKPWLAFVHKSDLKKVSSFKYRLHYRDWIVVTMDELLKFDDSFFFKAIE